MATGTALNLGSAALEHSFRPGRSTFLQIAEPPLVRHFTDNRTHLCTVAKWMPDLDCLEPVHCSIHKIIIDGFLHQPPRGIATNLAGVEGDGLSEFVGGFWDIDLIKDDGRSLASQLKFHRDQVLAAFSSHQTTHLR